MNTVAVSRAIAASQTALREAILDVEPFMRAGGFDEVSVQGDRVLLANTVGLLVRIELTLDIVDRDDAVLTLEQRSGIFEEMTARYAIEDGRDASTVLARTEFALDVAYVGPLFDATVVKRQRRRELTAQLDYLEAETV